MNTQDAYRACLAQAHAHYENFPVASRLLPRRLRGPVAAIYVFARRGDDLADEGSESAHERLAALDAMETELERVVQGREPGDDALWVALADSIHHWGLPDHELHSLLVAFRQDVTQTRYWSFDEVLGYCEHSANPVGRLLLHLVDAANGPNIAAADAVCTGLQLINFLQDLRQDLVDRDRLYIPQRDLARHGVTREMLATGEPHPPIQASARRGGSTRDAACREACGGACGARSRPSSAGAGASSSTYARASPPTRSRGRGSSAVTGAGSPGACCPGPHCRERSRRRRIRSRAASYSASSSLPWRCSETAPASVISTVWPSVMARPVSRFMMMMWMKNAMSAASSAGLPA